MASLSLHFTSLHFTTRTLAGSGATRGWRSLARSDESGWSTARARLGAVRARLGAVRARLGLDGGFAAKKPLTVCVFDF